jgi:hypothetical protein
MTEQSLKFNHQEREHMAVLYRRHAWLRLGETRPTPEGGYTEDNGYFAGEANALAWALDLLEGKTELVEVRLERHERRIRNLESRMGHLEHDLTTGGTQ